MRILLLLIPAYIALADNEPPWKEIRPKENDPHAAYLELVLNGTDEAKSEAYVKGCEEKLGKLPNIATDRLNEASIPVTLNGKRVVSVKEKLHYEENGKTTPIEAEFLHEDGKTLKKCDTPSLADPMSPCPFPEQKVVRLKSASEEVYWVAIIRPHGVNAPTGVLGWNSKTGATCFLGADKESPEEKTKYRAPGRDNCLRCHTQSDPFLVTPYVTEAFDKLGVPRQMKVFKEGAYRFHVPGLELSGLEHSSATLQMSHADGTPNTTCTHCHQVTVSLDETSNNTTRRILKDAIEKEWMPQDMAHGPSADEAKSSLLAYANKQPDARIKAVPVPDCERVQKSIGNIQAMTSQEANGERTLNWRLDDTTDPAKGTKIRFQIKVAASQWFHKTFFPSGVQTKSGWTMKHSFPADTWGDDITYEVTPLLYRPEDLSCPLVRGKTFKKTFPRTRESGPAVPHQDSDPH